MHNYEKWLVENQAVISEDIQNDALSWLNELIIEHGHDSVISLNCGSESFIKITKQGKLSGSKAGYKATLGFNGNYPYVTVLYSHHSHGTTTYSSKPRVAELWAAHKENREPAPLKPVITSTPQNNAVTAPKKSTVASDLSRFDVLNSTGEHDYLTRKQISTVHGSQLRFGSDKQGKYIALLVTDFKGTRRGVQRIYEDGAKRFSTGLEKVGGFISVGNYAGAAKIVICEGYATGASIHLATGYAVLCALDAGNLAHVAGGLKIWLELNNQKSIVIVAADNDASKPTNIGLTKARAACESTGFSLAYPTSNDSADFSDLHVTQGLSAVQECIDKATPVNSSVAATPITPVNSSENILMQDYSKPLKQGKAALVILSKCGLLLGFDQTFAQFRVYKDGKWELIEDLKPLISAWVNKQTCGGEYTDSWFKGTVNLVAANCVKDFSSRTKKHLIPFKNGVYDINKKALLPHSPDYCLTWQIPHDYASNADCPRFKEFLAESVTHDDVVQVLRAYINAVIFGRAYLQRYLQIIGAGGSGKSTFCEIVIELVGYANHKSSSLQSLEEDKFELAKYIDKRLICFQDQPAGAKNPSNFKKLTGNDSLPIRIMHKQTNADYTSDAMVILTANQDISTTDNSSGLHRRQITVRFDNQPKRDPRLKNELLKEVSGILNWAMELTSDEVEYLLSQENTSDTMQRQARDNLVATNPLARFFLDNFEPDGAACVPIGVYDVTTVTKEATGENSEMVRTSQRVIINQATHLYPHYRAYCEATGDRHISLNAFSSRCVDVLSNVLKWQGIHHERFKNTKVIRGIRFKAAPVPQDNDVDVQTAAYESENPAPMAVQTAPVAAPAPVVPHFYESILHVGDKQEMLKKWHYMTSHLNPEKKQELKRLSEEVYQQAFENEPSEIKRENVGRAAATEYLRKWASSHGVVSQ